MNSDPMTDSQNHPPLPSPEDPTIIILFLFFSSPRSSLEDGATIEDTVDIYNLNLEARYKWREMVIINIKKPPEFMGSVWTEF